ncbi:vWA domain-containing protein [Castellaniella sp.]|uniref:vWA domain-containing protein n=1 Tax=Castellaniella sp. TaxID=1955812 RepID=UPI002AFF8710|nr:vWA domain-containing protein [Castellaniella sp.]
MQEGKKTLYQRVLTTPGCQLVTAPGEAQGTAQPAFSRFYIYERQQSQQQDWLRIGPDTFGKTIGWMKANCTVDWKIQLTLAFTNPANRDRLLFFKDRTALESIMDAPDPVTQIAPLRNKLKHQKTTDEILAQEPETFIDLQKQFYLLPILSGEEVMTEEGFRMRLLNVASVSEAPQPPDGHNASNATADTTRRMKEFTAAVVFVIDSTISMDPYIDRTREAVRKIYQTIEAEHLGQQVKFGLVAFRSSTQAVSGLQYVSKMYADPNTVKDGQDFLAKVASLKQASVSSKLYAEDAYAGVMTAIDNIDWHNFGARYIVLITDASAIDGNNTLSSTGLDASQVRLEAGRPGIAIYTLHLKSNAGKKDHARAESQYRDLSTYAGTNTTLYYPVNAGDVNEFGAKVDALATAITTQVKAAYSGDDAIGSASNAQDDDNAAAQDPMLQDSALIGHAMRLAYLGSTTGTAAPPVFQAWISDRDLIKQNIATTDVRVLLTKAQLSDLNDVVRKVLQAANEGLISPADMFARLRSVAATMGADPNQLQQNSTSTLKDLGVMGEYMEGLPYHSDVLSLDEDTWKNWDVSSQEKFIRTLNSKLRLYQRYNEDVDRWVSLTTGSDARDNVYPVPLEAMP